MKKTILLLFFAFLTIVAFTQLPTASNGACEPGGTAHPHSNENATNHYASLAQEKTLPAKYILFPNPTVNWFSLDNESVTEGRASMINVYNLLGQRIRSFRVEKETQYDISDLQEGLYLVQLLDKSNKTIVTRRLHKMPGIRL